MARIDGTELVTTEYADDRRLAVRFRPFREWHDAPTPEERVLALVVQEAPGDVLEVGCGTGAFSQRIAQTTGAHVVAADQSPRMAALASMRGLTALVADVQALSFPDESFDVVIANWMLYHVPDLDRALAELRRVLRPGGRLIATTMGRDMLHELWDQVADDGSTPELSFAGDNGADVLARHFASVERVDLHGHATIPDRAAAIEYMEATLTRGHLAASLPEFEGPLRASTTNVVFVATR